MQPELTFRALSYGLIGILGIALVALWLISMQEEDERGEPFKGMLWLSVAIVASPAQPPLMQPPAKKRIKQGRIDGRKITARAVVIDFTKYSLTLNRRITCDCRMMVRRKKIDPLQEDGLSYTCRLHNEWQTH